MTTMRFWSARRSVYRCPVNAQIIQRPAQCDNPYHLKCLDPPLDAVPEGEWFCLECEANPGAPVGPEAKIQAAQSKLQPEEDSDEGDESATKAGQKRKAAAKSKATGE